MHYQSVWLERSMDSSLPYWLRVSGLAYGRHNANGHALFGPGEIGKLLAKPGLKGEAKPLSDSGVANAIKLAKRKGWIAQESMARCLVVPRHAVTGGLGGAAWTPCRAHPAGGRLRATA
jgi:hypothetical protein